jgi:hypothetical protein
MFPQQPALYEHRIRLARFIRRRDLRRIFQFHLKDGLAAADLTPVALAAAGGTGADVESWTRRA